MPTVSLIIPAHNEEKYIGECLDAAIKNSNGKFLEIIVIDNASTDKTKEVAEARSGVRVVREEKKGLTQARQRGFLEAKGDILAYVDADSKIPPQWLDDVINEFSSDHTLACLSGPYVYHDISAINRFFVWSYWNIFAVPTAFVVGYMAVGGNLALRRSVIEKMGGFDTTISFYGEDTNIARRASTYGKVKFKTKHFVYTSGRRFEGQGFIKTGAMYVTNFFSEVFIHKPVTKTYRDIR